MALDSFRRPSILQAFDLPAFKTPPALEERPSLPSIGLEISRPSSASTVASYTHLRHDNHAAIQLPALSTLASIASSSSPSANVENNGSTASSRRGTPPKMASPPPPSKPSQGISMTYATAAPATAGGQPNSPPVCQNCTTSTTPLWRRDESGSVLCNACGLFLKLHGRPRPISLKTDVIKSRNRVKTGSGVGRKKTESGSLPAAHPDADPAFAFQHRRASGKISSGLSERSQSPISRTGTPAFAHQSNIAPQHMFDAASGGMHPEAFHSPSLSAGFPMRQPSPSATSSVNGSHLEAPPQYETLLGQCAYFKTRASELEVINDLFRGRVTELENSEQEARQREGQLRAELEESRARESDLKRRIEELESEGPRHKKMRMSDLVDESRAGTPLSVLDD